jgi:heterodisulfide reductase subunit B
MKIGFFPGCSLEGSSREYNESLQAVAPRLGLELIEVPDWNCCGASAAHSLNHELARALPARILALAEMAGFTEILVPCSACFSRLAGTREALAHDADLRQQMAKIVGLPCAGHIRVRNVLEVLAACAKDGLAEKIRRPFAHKVACYYGCYLTRPKTIATCEWAEAPEEMDDIVRVVGAEPIDWEFKVECCGAGFSVSRLDTVARLSGRIVEDAVHRGAEAIVVGCPMCHTNLDLRRDAIEQDRRARYTIPVLYVSQVIGLALGLDERTLGLHRHHVPVRFSSTAAPGCESGTQPRAAVPQEAAVPQQQEH